MRALRAPREKNVSWRSRARIQRSAIWTATSILALSRGRAKDAEARKEFETSLALAPGLVEPLSQLVAMAFAAKGQDTAIERVRRQIALVPQSAALHHLLGVVHVTRKEPDRAEAAFLKALDLDPSSYHTYVALGRIYAETGRPDQALARLAEARKANPKDPVAHILTGMIHEQKGDIPKAVQAYEQALALNPRSALAGNNLAYLYSEHGGDKEKALQLAQLAKEEAPAEPQVSDTLGWILYKYKRGVYQRALALLKESAAKLPESPEVQYHLGMAALKVGDMEAAKRSLAAATAAPKDFVGKEEVRRALAQLK
jgi:tetratricopeptide (TPR) repeat protein